MIRIILITLLTLITSCKGNFQNKGVLTKTIFDYTGTNEIVVPVLSIDQKDPTALQSPYFSHSVGGKVIPEKTLVSVKYDSIYLIIHFECKDNPFMDQNYYFEDNTPLFNQEVFEVFISAGESSPEAYWEIQINPNNALLVGQVNNQYKSDQSFKLDLISNQIANIKHEVVKDAERNLWKGSLKIPLDLIQGSNHKNNKVFRINLFRIISTKKQEDHNWKVSSDNATFACWNSTMSETPNFHRPDYFGFLYLK